MHLGQFAKRRVDALRNQFRTTPACTDQVHRELVAVFQHGLQDMGRRQNLMAICQGSGLCTLNDRASALCVLFNIHLHPL